MFMTTIWHFPGDLVFIGNRDAVRSHRFSVDGLPFTTFHSTLWVDKTSSSSQRFIIRRPFGDLANALRLLMTLLHRQLSFWLLSHLCTRWNLKVEFSTLGVVISVRTGSNSPIVRSNLATRNSMKEHLKFRTLISHTRYYITYYFRSAFIEVKEWPVMPPPTALDWILVARRFAWPNQLVGFLSNGINA